MPPNIPLPTYHQAQPPAGPPPFVSTFPALRLNPWLTTCSLGAWALGVGWGVGRRVWVLGSGIAFPTRL